MTLIDYGILIIVAYHAFIGLKRGSIRILFDIIALILGVYCAMRVCALYVETIQSVVRIPVQIVYIGGFILVWGVVFTVVSFCGGAFHKILKVSIFRPLNLLGGLIFGATKGVLFILPFFIPLVMMNATLVETSMLAKPLAPFVRNSVHKLMPSAQETLEAFIGNFNSDSQSKTTDVTVKAIESKGRSILEKHNE